MAEGMEKGHKGFEKGHAPLPGCGRPLGSKSANTLLREFIRNMCVDLAPDVLKAMEQLKREDPKAFIQYYIKFNEFVVPKLSAIQFENEQQSSSASEHLRELASWDSNK